MLEKYCVKCTKVPAATPFFEGESVNLQFHNSNCSYSLSIVNFFGRAIVDICTCKSDLRNNQFLRKIALSDYLKPGFSFRELRFLGTATVKEGLFEASNFCKNNIYFFKTPPGVVHSLKYCVILFEESSSDRPFIFLTVLISFGGSPWAIHFLMEGDFLPGQLQPCIFSGGYMEQIIFDASCLQPLFGRPIVDIRFLRAVYLFHHSNCNHPILGVVYLFLSR